jgi:hypothetical protein
MSSQLVAFVPNTLLPECPFVAMPSQPAQESRKWHFSQEMLFLDILVLPQFKPIGGEGNGVIECKDVMHWMLSWCFEPCMVYSNSLLYNNSLVLVEQSGVDTHIKLWCWGKSSSPDTQGVARGLHS